MYPDNDWYGHKQILSDYCGIERAKPIFGSVRHGWGPHLREGVGERRFTSAPFFVWSERDFQTLTARGIPNVRILGAPFAYLVRSSYGSDLPPLGKGTLVFPAHEDAAEVPWFSPEELIHVVEAHHPPPYTVSIFFTDMSSRRLQPYRKSGWRVVSFGPRSNALFLHSLHAELVAHEAVIGNILQTGLVYGALLGRSIHVCGPKPAPQRDLNRQESSDDEPAETIKIYTELAHAQFPIVHNSGLAGSNAVEFGRYELGWDHLHDPMNLRTILGWDSFLRTTAAGVAGRILDVRLGRAGRKGQLNAR